MLKLALQDLASFAKNKTKVFVVVVLSLFMLFSSFFYFYSLAKSEQIKLSNSRSYLRTYFIEFENGRIQKDDKIKMINEILNRVYSIKGIKSFGEIFYTF